MIKQNIIYLDRQLEGKNRQLSDEVVECRERMHEQQEQIEEMKLSSENTQCQISHLEVSSICFKFETKCTSHT